MKVSVCITAYNHGNYISECLESVLNQKTTFDFEILVGEDDSKDNTRELVKAFHKNNPDKIRLFLNDRKDVIYIEGKPTGRWNFINNLKNAKGEYIALLDGDDFWTDPFKLQKQIDFLDSHKDFSFCFHNVVKINESNDRIGNYIVLNLSKEIPINQLLTGNIIPTSSVVFRNNLFEKFPDWFYTIPVADWFLHLKNAQYGKIGYLPEVLGAYRQHSGGIWSGMTRLKQYEKLVLILDLIQKYFFLEKNRIIIQQKCNLKKTIIKIKVDHNNYKVGNELMFILKNDFPKNYSAVKDLIFHLLPEKILKKRNK